MARRSLLLIFGVLFWLIFLANTAAAAGGSGQDGYRKIETYKVKLGALSELSEPMLDWRNPDYDLVFEMPTSDWIEKLDFFVRIHAEGQVNRNAPIFIRFNDGDPTPVYARGNSFEARINLDTSYVKAHRNMISISFGKDKGCIEQSDGAFSVDMDDSFLVVKASTPSRLYYLRDAKQILKSPLTTPKTVSINTFGPQKLKYLALGAQGIALNMPDLPRFKLGGIADAQLYIGTRQELQTVLKGSEIARREGPVVGVAGNAPLRLVLTADNHDQLDALVKSFASKELPPARRSFAFAGEYSWQSPFSVQNAAIDGKTPIYEMGNLRFDRGWGNSAQSVTFDVDNPLSANGQVKLNFERSPNVSKDSVVHVELNGETLGTVGLTSSRNGARFNIPTGLLVGTDNKLTINPELSPNNKASNCADHSVNSGFAVGARSYINVKSEAANFNGDLTRLAASGYPFSHDNAAGTSIVFSTRNSSDQAAALRAIAHLGKVYGTGWVDANFYAQGKQPININGHTLFIGPNFDANAPRELVSAIDGRVNSPRTIQTADSSVTPISLLSVRSPIKGGVMAIYDAEGSALKGYITTARGHSFTRAIDQIVQTDHWNKLQGSMAKWNGSRVEMAKTAFKAETDVMANTQTPETTPPSYSLPEISLPEVSMPDFSMPNLSMPKFSMPEFDFAPVQTTLNTGINETISFFADSWNGAKIAVGYVFPAKPEPRYKPVPKVVDTAPISVPTPFIKQAEQPKPIVFAKPDLKPMAKSTPAPRFELPATTKKPVLRKSAAIKTPAPLLVQKVQTVEQYDPGASLRGLSKITKSKVKASVATPQYQPKNASGSETELGTFARISSWMSGKLNGLMGSSVTESDKRSANLLVFAAALILLLLLLALARPVAHKN